ncbi:hypothetical protein H6P81_006266 [Aristolochia fimbriata]|uniref:Uncharacterized protein n=1 Tax=Aristolochia fimbriata TaxID=158543 RepID=A0AAV7F0Q4_ARIFI|nr:hypothetical protein H6P81_006266 [Aristolochia fimbriata]
MITWRKKENCPSEPSVSDILGSSSVVRYANHSSPRNESTLILRNMVASCLNQIDQPGQILRGHPLQALHKAVTKCKTDSTGEKPVLLQNHQKIFTQAQQFFSQQEFHSDKNNEPWPSVRCSRSSFSQPCKRREVKFFGQMLSHLAPLKQLSSSQGERRSCLPKTGLATLPDSAVLSSKYPGAVTDYHHLRGIAQQAKSSSLVVMVLGMDVSFIVVVTVVEM